MANENPDMVQLVEIGAGQCGTVFAVIGTEEVLKLPNSPEKYDLLYQDACKHSAVIAAFQKVGTGDFEISVPRLICWMNEQFNSRKVYESALPDHFQNIKYGIVSQRIFPLPLPTRKAIIDTFCPLRLSREVKANPKNKDCLIRVYLGRRDYTKRQVETHFSLRNFPMMVNDMELLELDTKIYAQNMAFALAVMHWGAKVDANDVEFVIGAKPFKRQVPELHDFEGVDKDHAQHKKFDLDFRKRTNHIWLLDFNECRSFDEGTGGWLDQLVRAFYFNDPYYPRPVSTDPRDQELWQGFRATYLDVSFKIIASDSPARFIAAVEKEGEIRRGKLALQSSGSLFKGLVE